MNSEKTAVFLSVILTIASSCIFLSSCKEKSPDGLIIFTQVTGKEQINNNGNADSQQLARQSRIVAVDPHNPVGALKVLTEGYYSARSPEVSSDGKYLLFAAQQKQNEIWQIYEMNLRKRIIRQITSSSENCTDPAYLPGGRLVFSKINVNDTLKTGYSLYVGNLNGSDLKRITFNPNTFISSAVLKDGRILTISKQLYPVKAAPLFMILRPDGTKSELFYKGMEGNEPVSRGLETDNGEIVFIESDGRNITAGNITSIKYNRPLHSRVNLTSAIKGDFQTVYPLSSGKLLVSYRPSETDHYALYEFDPETKVLGKSVFNSPDYDAVEAVVVRIHERPKKLPSEVDTGVKTGLLLCQDINLPEMRPSANNSLSKASRIEILGIDSTLGVVQVSADGSFYLKIMADKPFRIQTLDENGRVLNKPCGWLWLRPNERRGCVGCHEDHEQVPENRVPLAVKNLPVNIPVHINKVKEKKVSLE